MKTIVNLDNYTIKFYNDIINKYKMNTKVFLLSDTGCDQHEYSQPIGIFDTLEKVILNISKYNLVDYRKFYLHFIKLNEPIKCDYDSDALIFVQLKRRKYSIIILNNETKERDVCARVYVSNFKQIIYDNMIIELKCALTIGRTDEGLVAYTPQQIEQFILENKKNIQKAVDAMFISYEEENILDDLLNPMPDWFRDDLFENVELPDV